MRIAICDDERVVRNTLEEMIKEYGELRRIDIMIDKFQNGHELLHAMISKEYELVFMDYILGDMNGIEVTRIIKKQNNNCAVILVTAYIDSILETDKVNFFRYIKKPIRREQLFNSISEYIFFLKRDDLFIINTHERTWKIRLSDILYAEAMGKNTLIRTTDKTIEVHTNLKEIEAKLPPERFCRCQKSFIVSFHHVKNHTNKEIIVDNNERVQIGRKYLSYFKKSFINYVILYNIHYL